MCRRQLPANLFIATHVAPTPGIPADPTSGRSDSLQIRLPADPTPCRSDSQQIRLPADPTPSRSDSLQIQLPADPTPGRSNSQQMRLPADPQTSSPCPFPARHPMPHKHLGADLSWV
eukprot:354229-Chlamydomonas_euryale.AAC.4